VTLRVRIVSMLVLALTAIMLVPGQAAAAPAPPKAAPKAGPEAAPKAKGPVVAAHSAILVDPVTGAVMWERNPTVARAPASLTKMLTAITAKASLPMTRRMIVSPSANKVQATHLALGAGHDVTVAQALTALMMISANDMAVVLAQHAAGSLPRFAKAMDVQSRRLGLTSSRWRNPNGLDADGHVSSAYDLAILTRAVLDDPWLAEVASRRNRVAFRTPDGITRSLWNKSHFLREYPGAVGIKTGFTNHAGHCLAAAATRGGRTLVAIVLASPDTVKDAGALLDWGFGAGRAARTGRVLPPYVAPESVSDLLGPGPGAAARRAAPASMPQPLAQAAPTPSPSPSPTAEPEPGASSAGGASLLPSLFLLGAFVLLILLTMRTRRRATRLGQPDDQEPRARPGERFVRRRSLPGDPPPPRVPPKDPPDLAP
jgi:D-alanyl-D-alanine carboxypeptidase (penicillin-binding protein 5/6)